MDIANANVSSSRRRFAAACAVSLVLSVAATRWSPGLAAALAGWGAAILQAAAATRIHRHAVGGGDRFLAWSLGSLALRAAFLLGLLALVRASQVLPFAPFAMALVLSYFTLLYTEIARLHLESTPAHRHA